MFGTGAGMAGAGGRCGSFAGAGDRVGGRRGGVGGGLGGGCARRLAARCCGCFWSSVRRLLRKLVGDYSGENHARINGWDGGRDGEPALFCRRPESSRRSRLRTLANEVAARAASLPCRDSVGRGEKRCAGEDRRGAFARWWVPALPGKRALAFPRQSARRVAFAERART